MFFLFLEIDFIILCCDCSYDVLMIKAYNVIACCINAFIVVVSI